MGKQGCDYASGAFATKGRSFFYLDKIGNWRRLHHIIF